MAPNDPFATPAMSSTSIPAQYGSRSIISATSVPRRRFKSSRLVGEYEKPWLGKKERKVNWDAIIYYSCVGVGMIIGAFLCWRAYNSVPQHDYCLVMDDRFTTFDTANTWNHEIQVDGFGTGSFDWTTTDSANSYVDGTGLHIVPTLTLQSTAITYDQMLNGYTVNLTSDGTCTAANQDYRFITDSNDLAACVVRSNASHGSIINPVRSARLTTKGKKTIKYGRVEVVAKMPKGDWLWPAIWMMPEDSVYGVWPRSGEIDIAEIRGNDPVTYPIGNNQVMSSLHWGTAAINDMYLRTSQTAVSKRDKTSEGFHTFGLEWSENYLFMWLDYRLRQVFYMDFSANKNMWSLGGFAGTTVNGTAPDDPWSQTGNKNTPFDQPFYLILDVAVGSTNGYFPDSVGVKPWGDQSKTAMRDFWKANSTWLPTWGKGDARGMTVQSVKMWQQGKC